MHGVTGLSPLRAAATRAKPRVVKLLLLQRGADGEARDPLGRGALGAFLHSEAFRARGGGRAGAAAGGVSVLGQAEGPRAAAVPGDGVQAARDQLRRRRDDAAALGLRGARQQQPPDGGEAVGGGSGDAGVARGSSTIAPDLAEVASRLGVDEVAR
jgi:hypothetical protein